MGRSCWGEEQRDEEAGWGGRGPEKEANGVGGIICFVLYLRQGDAKRCDAMRCDAVYLFWTFVAVGASQPIERRTRGHVQLPGWLEGHGDMPRLS